MTRLSVNINKIALLRNARGRDYPNVVDFARRFIDLGVHGITIHPRQDERHIKRQDAYDLAEFIADYPHIEYNIEGYPSEDFIALIADTHPTQCTLVPDSATQLTSDHGWDFNKDGAFLKEIGQTLAEQGVRPCAFIDPNPEQAALAAKSAMARVELYTESFAQAYSVGQYESVKQQYISTAAAAQAAGLGVNAGHDLDLQNLSEFLTINGILEVSIGHALTIESIEQGMDNVTQQYLQICKTAAH